MYRYLNTDKMIIEKGKTIQDVRREANNNANKYYKVGILLVGLMVFGLTGEMMCYKRFLGY